MLEVKPIGDFSPFMYQWDNATQDITAKIINLSAGIRYKVTITDNKGCTKSNSASRWIISVRV